MIGNVQNKTVNDFTRNFDSVINCNTKNFGDVKDGTVARVKSAVQNKIVNAFTVNFDSVINCKIGRSGNIKGEAVTKVSML